jgi:hypothetical protein
LTLRQREPRIELPKLRKSAKDAPCCMVCHVPNTDGNLVLAHSNWQEHGKGVGVKCHDIFGAIVCARPGGCHDVIDGRASNLSAEERRLMWERAHRATLVWWVQEGYLK